MLYLVYLQSNLLNIIYRAMTKEVKQIIISILKDSEIASSWGISNIRIMNNSVVFSVDGMKYKGDVVIKASSDKKCILKFKDEIDISCTYDMLVKTIDEKIEYSANYIEEIQKWLHKKTQL